MALVIFTRRFVFRGTHALEVGEHREKRHGHRYHLEVSASAQNCEGAFNFAKDLAKRLDGNDLGQFCELTTGENLVEWIDSEFRRANLGVFAIALQETRKNRFLSAKSSELAL